MQAAKEAEDGGVVRGSSEPDYSAVKIQSKAPTQYSYVERRAELLQLVEQAGHPKALNQSELADRYGVSQQQISKDLDRLDEYYRDNINARRDLTIRATLERCIRGALENDDWDAARRAAEALDDYLDRRINTLEFQARLGRLEKIADREGPQ